MIDAIRTEFEDIFSDVLRRQGGKREPIELTEKEKFAMCLIAGVPIDCDVKENIAFFKTKYPCGVAWNGFKFVIGYKMPDNKTHLAYHCE